MPAAGKYGEPGTEQWKAAEAAYTTESTARLGSGKLHWEYYLGEHKKHLRPDKSKVDDNIIINLIGLIVDKGISALMGTSEVEVDGGVKFKVIDQPGEAGFEQQNVLQKIGSAVREFFGAGKKPAPSPVQDYLDLVFRANNKNILLHDLGLYGGLLGHVFTKLVPEGITDPETGQKVTRIVNLDPKIVTVFWDGGDYSRVLWYRVQYSDGVTIYREDTVRRIAENGTDMDAWDIYRYEREEAKAGKSQGEWQKAGDPEPWPYPFAPIIDWKNLPMPGSYYGRDDVIQNSMKLNDALNFVASNIARILKHHASPKTIATGVEDGGVKATAIDSLWTIAKPDAKVYNLEMQTDLKSSLDFMQFLRRAAFDGARELDPASVQDQLGALTNFALRVLYHDTLMKGGTKRLLYGEGLMRLCRALLVLGKHSSMVKLSVDWPEPLPSDPLSQAQALQIDVQVGGLSKETYLEKRGYDPDQEAERREMEQFENSMGTPSKPDPLEAFMSQARAQGMQQPPVGATPLKPEEPIGSTGQQPPGSIAA